MTGETGLRDWERKREERIGRKLATWVATPLARARCERYLDGVTLSEIAEDEGVKRSSVRGSIRRVAVTGQWMLPPHRRRYHPGDPDRGDVIRGLSLDAYNRGRKMRVCPTCHGEGMVDGYGPPGG